MEKTTIYLDKDIKMHLLEMVADISKRQGKRAAMSDIIRDALREYFERQKKAEEDDRHE
jgi:metal-responsive CopG/Arc/MetJ family transcriptional regulator